LFPLDQPIVSSSLIGRESQKETLERALAGVQAGGTGQCLILAGEAGVGKSRLMAEIRRTASQSSFVILAGHCFEPDLIFPYAPLIDALRTFFAAQSSDQTAAQLGPLAAELVKLLPELALTLPGAASPTPSLDPESEKRRLFEALAQFLTRLTTSEGKKGPLPLLLLMEDLHWSDETSLSFLHFFAYRLRNYSILLLASYRPEEAGVRLIHWLAQFDRERLAQEIRLSLLSRPEVDRLLQAIFKLQQPVRAEFLEAVHTLTEGNPFFIEEILKSLIVAGEIFYKEGQWDRKPLAELHLPRSIMVAVQRRLEQLSPSARQLITLAAVVGRRFDFALLHALTYPAGPAPPDQYENELLGYMKELTQAQLVVEESAERFAFRHALTREAVYATLLARERRALHRKVAELLEQTSPEFDLVDPPLADLAYHFYEAGVWAKAITYSQQAGIKAQSLYSPAVAVEHFNRADQSAQRLAIEPPLTLYQARGKAYEWLGDFEAAHQDYSRALSASRQAQDPQAEWQSLLDLGFLWSGRDYQRMGDCLREALTLARANGDPQMLAHSLNRLGNWYLVVEQPLEAQRYHQEALAILQGTDYRPGLAQTFDLLGVTHFMAGDLVQGANYYEQAISLFRQLDDRHGLVSSLTMFSFRGGSYTFNTTCSLPTSLAECVQDGAEAVAMAQQIGWRAGEAGALVYLALILGPAGAYDRALETAQAALELATEIQARGWLVGAHCALGALKLDLLALPAAQTHLEQAWELAKEIGPFFISLVTGLLASTCVAQGQLAQAETLLKPALGATTPERAAKPGQTQGQRTSWCAQAELALARQQPEIALQIIDGLITSAPNVAQYGQGCIPRLWLLRGQALAALDQPSQTEAAWQAALRHPLTQARRPLLWRIHMALGKWYQTQRRFDEARRELAAAGEIVAALAAPIPDSTLREEFQRRALALRPALPAPRPSAKPVPGGLTRREAEVAVWLAQGKSNREIAQALVVTERTVEAHVGNILAKLNFSSRAQIAVWAVENDLTKSL
jgi:DNA-binding CsgD family transcriptional regulator